MLVLRRIVAVQSKNNSILWEIPIQGLSYEVAQNAVSVYSVTVRSGDFQDPEDHLYQDFEIWYKGHLLMPVSLEEYQLDNTGTVLTLTMWDPFGKLVRTGGDSRAIVPPIGQQGGRNIPYVLHFLLRSPLDPFDPDPPRPFQLGDSTTFNRSSLPFYFVNIDLRKEDTRFSQIVKTINQKQDLFIRYGGRLQGDLNEPKRFMVDLGSFGEPADFDLISGDTLRLLTVNKSNNIKIRGIESFGGQAGDNARRLNLRDAYDYNTVDANITGTEHSFEGTFLTPNTPTFLIKNSVDRKGYILRREYPEIKLTGTPTAAEIRKAGYWLFQRTLRDLESNQDTVSYTAEVVLDEDIYGPVPDTFISKTTRLRYTRKTDVLDQATGLVRKDSPAIDIDSRLRITSYRAVYENGRFLYTLTLSPNQYEPIQDEAIQLYDTFSPDLEIENVEYTIPASLDHNSTFFSPVTHGPGVAADTTMFDGRAAKLFSIPTFVLGTERYYSVIFNHPRYDYEIRRTSLGTSTNNVLIHVAPKGADWTISSVATVNLEWTIIG